MNRWMEWWMDRQIVWHIFFTYVPVWGFPGGSVGKESAYKQETSVWSLGWKDALEKEMAVHSGIFAWEIPWTEKSGRLQTIGWQRVEHDWVTKSFNIEMENQAFHFYWGRDLILSLLEMLKKAENVSFQENIVPWIKTQHQIILMIVI